MNEELRKKLIIFGSVGGGFFVVDQVMKWITVHHFKPTVTVIPNLFNLVFVKNEGAAWGILQDLPDNMRVPFFALVSLAAVAMVSFLAYKAEPNQKLLLVSLGMVLGGALGNLTDRVRQGFVVDFLDFWVPHGSALDFWDGIIRVSGTTPSQIAHHYPSFNVADIGITVGVALLILDSVLNWRAERKKAVQKRAAQKG